MDIISFILTMMGIGVVVVVILAIFIFAGESERQEKRKKERRVEIRQQVRASRDMAAIKQTLPYLRWRQIGRLIGDGLTDTSSKSLSNNPDRIFLQEARGKLRRREPVDGARIVDALRALECFVYANAVEEALSFINDPDSDPMLAELIDRQVEEEVEAEFAPTVSRPASSSTGDAFIAGILSAALMDHAQKQWEKERAEWREWRFK